MTLCSFTVLSGCRETETQHLPANALCLLINNFSCSIRPTWAEVWRIFCLNIVPVKLTDRKVGFQFISSKTCRVLIFPQDTKCKAGPVAETLDKFFICSTHWPIKLTFMSRHVYNICPKSLFFYKKLKQMFVWVIQHWWLFMKMQLSTWWAPRKYCICLVFPPGCALMSSGRNFYFPQHLHLSLSGWHLLLLVKYCCFFFFNFCLWFVLKSESHDSRVCLSHMQNFYQHFNT